MSVDGDCVVTHRKLSESSHHHVIDVAFERVDLAGWLFSLPSAEYVRLCPPDHLACGTTTTDDGEPMAIAVESIGGTLMVQQYVAQIHRVDRCELVSHSAVFPPSGGRTTTQVTWTLSVEALDDTRSVCTNSVVAHATLDFLRHLERSGESFAEAAAARQAAVDEHERREALAVAASITRRALAA